MPQLIAPALVGSLGISSTAATLVSGLVFTAGSILLQSILAPEPPKPENGKVPIKQSTPPRGYAYGPVRVTGSVMLHESYTEKGDLLKVHALVSHRCHGFLEYYLHDDKVTLDGSGNVQFSGDKYGDGAVRLYTRLGLVPETAYPEIVSRTPLWTEDHRGDGICSLAMVAGDVEPPEDHQKTYPNGAPIPGAALASALVYDPREEDQDPDDEDTWAYSVNPILHFLHHKCFSEFGDRRPYATTVLPYLENWKQAADDCDAEVALAAGGTEPRYRCGVSATTENNPKAVQALILASCDGWTVDMGDGGLDVVAGVYREPEVTLDGDEILGFDLRGGIADEEEVNRLDLVFTNPATKWTEDEVTPWQDEAHQVKRGRVLEQKYPLTSVWSPTQTRRLGRREWDRLRQKVRGTLHVKAESLWKVRRRWVKVASDQIPELGDAVIEIGKAYLSLIQGVVRVEYVAIDPATIDAWDPETDEGTLPTVPDEPEPPEIRGPDNVTIDFIAYSQVIDGSDQVLNKSVIRVVLEDAPFSFPCEVRWTWTEQAPEGPIEKTESELFTDIAGKTADGVTTLFVFHNIPQVEELSVQVATKYPGGFYSDWAPDPATVLDTRLIQLPFLATAGEELRATTSYSLRAI